MALSLPTNCDCASVECCWVTLIIVIIIYKANDHFSTYPLQLYIYVNHRVVVIFSTVFHLIFYRLWLDQVPLSVLNNNPCNVGNGLAVLLSLVIKEQVHK